MSTPVVDTRERESDLGVLRSLVLSETVVSCGLVSTWTMTGETFSVMLVSKAL
jgi:hypothetical protein